MWRLRFHVYLIDSCMDVLGAVCVTGRSTCGRPDLLVQGAGTRCAAQPGAILVRREYTRRGRYPACLYSRYGQLALSAAQPIALPVIVLIIWSIPLSRLMEGNSGADRAPSLSSWSIRPDATVLRPDLRPGCWGNVRPLRGNEFDLKPTEKSYDLNAFLPEGVECKTVIILCRYYAHRIRTACYYSHILRILRLGNCN